MRENEKYLEKHPYKIWQGSDGNWRTHIPDPSTKEGRRLVKRKEEQALKDFVVSFWKEDHISEETKKPQSTKLLDYDHFFNQYVQSGFLHNY